MSNSVSYPVLGFGTITKYLAEDLDVRRDIPHAGKLVLAHRKYSFPCELPCDFAKYSSHAQVEKFLRRTYNPALILPVYMMDHSGLAFKHEPFGCRWDSGQLGFHVLRKAAYRKYRLKSEQEAKQLLDAELQLYNSVFYTLQLLDIYGDIVDQADVPDSQVDAQVKEWQDTYALPAPSCT